MSSFFFPKGQCSTPLRTWIHADGAIVDNKQLSATLFSMRVYTTVVTRARRSFFRCRLLASVPGLLKEGTQTVRRSKKTFGNLRNQQRPCVLLQISHTPPPPARLTRRPLSSTNRYEKNDRFPLRVSYWTPRMTSTRGREITFCLISKGKSRSVRFLVARRALRKVALVQCQKRTGRRGSIDSERKTVASQVTHAGRQCA